MTHKGNILAVDDTPASLRLLTELLRAEGYDVRPAICGDLALRAAAANPPELILLDVRMPEMDGFEVCRRLAQQPATRDVPVIFLSGLSDVEDKVEGFALGAVDFVTKPFQREELLARVRTALDMTRLRTRLESLVDERARELKESNARYDRLVRNIPIGVYQYRVGADGSHAFNYVSPKLGELLGVPPNAMLSDLAVAFDAFLPEDREELIRLNREAAEARRIFSWEGRLRRDGETRWLRIESHPEEEHDGGCTWHGIVEDITERWRAEEALAKAIERLTASNLELERFAYVASHDLQEPLRNISHYAQLTQRCLGDSLTPQCAELLGFVIDGAKRMTRLINDLLTYSHIDRPFAATPVNLAEACADALANLREAITEAEATIVVEPLPVVKGHALQLTRLFQNLIGNAVKFHRPDAAPRVVVSSVRHEGEWIVTVADNGIGIASTDQDIFQVFRRLHGPADFPGSGIGLAICKRIVLHHGGRIWFDCPPDGGTAFRFALPADETA